MTISADFKSGKTERDENFPVASQLIAPRFRGPILAFYRFARAADDAADHPTLSEPEKFAILDSLEDTLMGKSDAAPDALPLRRALAATDLSARHPLDLLVAFRQDVTKRRYGNWDELMEYCRYSAMPVGRFVLDVHGESQNAWAPSDALCSALQVINHLQDCGKDYRAIDRVYLPLDALAAHETRVEALAASAASPQLRACLVSLAKQTEQLMGDAALLPERVKDMRLGLETAVIVRLANVLLGLLKSRDPLSERVHLSAASAAIVAARAAAGALPRRFARQLFPSVPSRRDAQ
jgi:hydroxysqualene synthase